MLLVQLFTTQNVFNASKVADAVIKAQFINVINAKMAIISNLIPVSIVKQVVKRVPLKISVKHARLGTS